MFSESGTVGQHIKDMTRMMSHESVGTGWAQDKEAYARRARDRLYMSTMQQRLLPTSEHNYYLQNIPRMFIAKLQVSRVFLCKCPFFPQI